MEVKRNMLYSKLLLGAKLHWNCSLDISVYLLESLSCCPRYCLARPLKYNSRRPSFPYHQFQVCYWKVFRDHMFDIDLVIPFAVRTITCLEEVPCEPPLFIDSPGASPSQDINVSISMYIIYVLLFFYECERMTNHALWGELCSWSPLRRWLCCFKLQLRRVTLAHSMPRKALGWGVLTFLALAHMWHEPTSRF